MGLDPEGPRPAAKPRILFVEDEPILRAHLAEALSEEYSVDTAGSGREALTIVLRAKPDIVVTDIVMPEMDGVELLRTLRSVPSTQSIPVLLLSGRAAEDRRVEGFREGADGYLAKPYSERELRALIGSMIHSARRRAEAIRREAVAEAERLALTDRAALLESITDAFFALDRDWRFTYVNQRALDYYGKGREELLGRSIWDVFPIAAGTMLHEQYKKVLRTQRSATFETKSVLTGRWVDIRAYPTGQGLAVYFRDISDRKRAEQELQAALTKLEESDRRKDEFLALLSHELRNPLAPIANGLALLKLRGPDEPGSQRALGIMERQLNHLVRLVDDLLDVGRMTHGKLQLRMQKVSLLDILGRAIEGARSVLESRGHTLATDARVRDLMLEGDADRLIQVFTNLIHNSAKYTDTSGRIRITLDREGDEAVIAVTDNGVGIPANALEQVFEMFSQVKLQQPRAGGGLGIGLALVRTIVQMHGGTIRADSAGTGLGSTFTVRLPLARGRVAANAVAATGAAVTGAAGVSAEVPGGEVPRILVVDDNGDAAASLADLLRLKGFPVLTAATGEEAIEKAQVFRPRIIFMDIGLPGIDGVETTLRIRALPQLQGVTVVAVTGWGQPSDRARTRAAGIVAHLLKPVAQETLERTLAEIS